MAEELAFKIYEFMILSVPVRSSRTPGSASGIKTRRGQMYLVTLYGVVKVSGTSDFRRAS